jgi:hypothetical protein
MSDTNTQFIRKYKRQSQSIWKGRDMSTLLLYCDVVSSDENNVELSFTNYIYMHRDDLGRPLGLSISKKMLEDNADFASRYLEDIHMYCFLLIHLEKITNFCCLFADEFESIFLLEPRAYFAAAETRWFNIIEDV